MSQPPEHPQSPAPRDPSRAVASEASPAGSQGPEAEKATRAGKGPLLAAVGCGLLALVLVLSLAAFFGVRTYLARNEPADTGPSSTSEQPAAPGETNALPQGTVITIEQPATIEGTLDIAIGKADWDAADWVAEQNSSNPVPTDHSKYVMVPAEVTYHGPAEFSSTGFTPVDYVAADGIPYGEADVVTPTTADRLSLHDGETGTLYWVFMVPEGTSEGGHFVVADGLPQDEALVEGQWVEAA